MVTDMVADMEVDKAADMAEVNISTYYFFSLCRNIRNYGVLYRNIGQILLCVTRPSRLTIWI